MYSQVKGLFSKFILAFSLGYGNDIAKRQTGPVLKQQSRDIFMQDDRWGNFHINVEQPQSTSEDANLCGEFTQQLSLTTALREHLVWRALRRRLRAQRLKGDFGVDVTQKGARTHNYRLRRRAWKNQKPFPLSSRQRLLRLLLLYQFYKKMIWLTNLDMSIVLWSSQFSGQSCRSGGCTEGKGWHFLQSPLWVVIWWVHTGWSITPYVTLVELIGHFWTYTSKLQAIETKEVPSSHS